MSKTEDADGPPPGFDPVWSTNITYLRLANGCACVLALIDQQPKPAQCPGNVFNPMIYKYF